MCLEVTSSCEGVFTTAYASEEFSSCLCLYVRLEVSSLSAGVIALCAVERLSPECVSMCVLKLLTLAQDSTQLMHQNAIKLYSQSLHFSCVL